jgi:hypothetical protein
MAKCDINNKQRLFDVLKSKDIVDMANDNNIEYRATLSGSILNVSVKSGVDNAYIVQSLIENAVNNSFPGILLSSRTEDGYINTILFTERVNNTIKDKRNKRIAKLRFDRSIVRNDGEVISPSGYPAIPMANDRNGIIKNLEKQIHQEATNAWDLGEVADVSNRGVGKLINEYYKSDVVSYYDEGTDLTFARVQVPEFLVDIYYNELSNIIKERREKWSSGLMEQSSFWDENGDVDQYNSISTTNTEDDIWNDDSGLDKQRIKAQYSQYLKQNPNGSVEGFKEFINVFNKTNLEHSSRDKPIEQIYKENPYLEKFINSVTNDNDNISIYNVKEMLDKHGEGRIVKLNKILYNAINRLWDNNIFAKNNLKIKFVDYLPENAVGNFNREDNEITVDKRKFLNNVANEDESYPIFYLGYILNHEIIHYLTPEDLSLKIEYVDRALNGKFGKTFELPSEREFGKNIKELYDIAIKELDNTEDYGFLNLAEFVAEAMSNPSFQEKLASIPYKSSKKSLWKRFIEILSAYLSLDTKTPITDTLLEAVIAETTNYITENSNIQRTYKKRSSGKTESIDLDYDFVFTTQKNIQGISDFLNFQQSLNKPNTNPILQGNQNITQDDKSYYRGQIEQPTIDKNGNLVLYAREDELYKRAGLKSKGVSMTDDLQSAIEYGSGQLEVSKNLASEENIGIDLERELDRLDENGYYLIQIPKNISNEIVKEAGEVKVIGDKIVIPKGQYKIEQVIDGVEDQTILQQEQVKKFDELQERLNNKEFLEGAKNAFESSEELQNVYYEAVGFKQFQFEPLNKYSSLNKFTLSKKEEAVAFLQSLDGKKLFSPSEMLMRISKAETSEINKGLSDYLNTILEQYKGIYTEESVNPYRIEFKENLKLSNDDTGIEFGTLGGYNQAGKKFFNLDEIETRDIITIILHEFAHDIEPFVRTKDGFISSKAKNLQTPLTEKQKELGGKLNELRRFTINYLAEDFKKNRVAKLEQDVIDYENGKILEPFGRPASKVYIDNLKLEIEKTKKVIENNEVEKYIEKSTNIFFYKSHYGLSNINEFVAEALTNEKFREVLNNIPYKNTTLLSYLFELFQKILGIKKDTVLSEALNLIHELATTEREQLNEKQITPQQKQEALNAYTDYIARVSLGIVKNPSSGEYNYYDYNSVENYLLETNKIKKEC